jgi:hypothetical protein
MVTLAHRAQFHGQEELQSIDQFSNVGWLMIMSTLEELIKCRGTHDQLISVFTNSSGVFLFTHAAAAAAIVPWQRPLTGINPKP